VLVDLHKTDAMLQLTAMNFGHEEEKRIYYAQVLEKHGITQAQFDSTLVWYTAHPQLFDKIYPKVMADLKAEEEAFVALHEEELNARPTLSGAARPTPPVQVFTREQMDSVLWVTAHGYPSTWSPAPEKSSVHDTENQFFPQIGVLR